jgi:hypothetical protein
MGFSSDILRDLMAGQWRGADITSFFFDLLAEGFEFFILL